MTIHSRFNYAVCCGHDPETFIHACPTAHTIVIARMLIVGFFTAPPIAGRAAVSIIIVISSDISTARRQWISKRRASLCQTQTPPKYLPRETQNKTK
jgi:hypothetical protein